ncbi:hypothetical protein H2200_001636 [Cladophialophora chaetospira]|uniref:Uncharacterized protein n=1 Tax=Cladophialophora chaetospira TaxID=386627 RepID=A0AA38XLB7_9EURO|nr:hypothetical protein H2200_001636 [Cladophialophora chaetospira]
MGALAYSSGKILPTLALFVTTTVSVVLLVFRNHLFGGNFPTIVEDSRSAVQVVVQILSFFLAMLQVYVLRTLFGYATRLLLPGRRLNLDKLSLPAAISQGKLDFSLSKHYLVIIFAVVGLTALPPALFSKSSSGLWDSEFYLATYEGTNIEVYPDTNNCTATHDERGLFPTCPVPTLQGLLLSSAGTATSTNPNQPRVHARLDNARWSYSGRSFGVGSSAGIAQPAYAGAADAFVGYKYRETGYLPQVQCEKNESSALSIKLITSKDGFYRYDVYGPLANEPPGTYEAFPITSWDADSSNLLAWAARSYNRSNIITLASGHSGYTSYNQTQCEVTFVPTTFEVSVNLTAKLITVEALPDDTEDFEPTGHLAFNTIQSINFLGRFSCNALWISVIGQTLLQNEWNMQQRLNTSDLGWVAFNAAIAESFTAMIDDILVAYGASQLVNANDTIPVSVTGMRKAVSIGKPIWTYAVFSFNSFVMLAFLIELLRTRFWHGLPQFDYTNMKCTIAAVGVAEQTSHWSPAREYSKRWTGDPSDPAFRHMEVVFKQYGSSVTGELNMPLLQPKGSSRSIPLSGLQQKLTSHDIVSNASLLDENEERPRSFV